MNTKERILQAARKMFNEYGIENTSAKMIAAEIAISDGNLRYYFRTKEDLVYGLYMELAEGFNQQFVPYDTEDSFTLSQLYQSLYAVYTRLYEHRYLMTDFMAIMRNYSKIETHYRELVQYRKQQFRRVIDILRQQGILKAEVGQRQYENMIEQFNLLSDTWIGHAEVFMKEAGIEEKIGYYVRLAFSMIVPYLTEEGKNQYEHSLQKN